MNLEKNCRSVLECAKNGTVECGKQFYCFETMQKPNFKL